MSLIFFRQKARLFKVLPSVGRSRCRAKQVFEGLKRSNKAPAENLVLDSIGSEFDRYLRQLIGDSTGL